MSPNKDFDSPWKDVLEELFKPFIRFFSEEAYREIDWRKKPRQKDKELRRIVPDAEFGNRVVDLLYNINPNNLQLLSTFSSSNL